MNGDVGNTITGRDHGMNQDTYRSRPTWSAVKRSAEVIRTTPFSSWWIHPNGSIIVPGSDPTCELDDTSLPQSLAAPGVLDGLFQPEHGTFLTQLRQLAPLRERFGSWILEEALRESLGSDGKNIPRKDGRNVRPGERQK